MNITYAKQPTELNDVRYEDLEWLAEPEDEPCLLIYTATCGSDFGFNPLTRANYEYMLENFPAVVNITGKWGVYGIGIPDSIIEIAGLQGVIEKLQDEELLDKDAYNRVVKGRTWPYWKREGHSRFVTHMKTHNVSLDMHSVEHTYMIACELVDKFSISWVFHPETRIDTAMLAKLYYASLVENRRI